MIVQWNISSGAYIATLPGYPKGRPWGANWRNPGALVENCPDEYKGYGYGPVRVTTALGFGEVWDGAADIPNGAPVDGAWECDRPKRAMTDDETAAALAVRKATMKAQAAARFAEVIAAGKRVSGKTIDISAEGFARLEQARHVVPIQAVTVRGDPIDLPDTATVDAILVAGRAQYKAAAERERALVDAVDAAADGAALDLVDIAAGSVDGVGAWPQP